MSENCIHKPDAKCKEFLKRYFHKDGALTQTYRCKHCGGNIRFTKKPAYRLFDVIVWLLLLAFMIAVRLVRDSFTVSISLWLYILLAVAAVFILGIVLDMTKEWFLLKRGHFELYHPEPAPEVIEDVQNESDPIESPNK